jgi:prolyl oligopeptidase
MFATADDGTRIPMTVLHLRSAPIDGNTPTRLYAYGSYGISQQPYFSATIRAWLEQGCVYAVANIRGGGEYGDEWHRQANLANKRVSIDDMAACARHLVSAGYTRPDRLALEGGSAGGLLVYGVAVHHPEVAGTVVSHVGISDMLRVELAPNGEFNITEFGTVRDETQFHAMHALSPYHHVKEGVEYPSVLSLTGIHDPRVEPWQPFKMTAKLQAAGGPNPVLLRVNMSGGHGRGTTLSEGVRRRTDVNAFLFERLGVEYRPTEPRAD